MKPVIHAEVMPYAKPGCSSCHGIGELTIIRPVHSARICGCALKRFLKANAGKVKVEKKGQLSWREETTP